MRIFCNGVLIDLLFLLFLLPSTLYAQKEAELFDVDTTLYNYYQKCKDNIDNASVLIMCDTLYTMAAKHSDQRMQAVALSTKMDYYYYAKNIDSLKAHVRYVMDFGKKTNQPKYYYFAWGKRLIVYYINQGLYTMALFESEKMLKEAQVENDMAGISTCYNALSTIYTAKTQRAQAFKYQMEQALLIEKHKLDDYNESMVYLSVSSYLSDKEKLEEAFKWLQKADETANNVTHEFYVILEYIHYYLCVDNEKLAKKYMDDAVQMYNTDKSLKRLIVSLLSSQVNYYRYTKQYAKALSTLRLQQTEEEKRDKRVFSRQRIRTMGDLHWMMNNKDSAAFYYMEYLTVDDSVRIAAEQKTAGEFAMLLNVEKLNAENSELTLNSNLQQLRSRKTIIILLVLVLAVAFILLYRENRHNNKLQQSEDLLLQKNIDLRTSEGELRLAKEMAEAASLMKSTFIQNMSHEIRTPLNSIVGFSQVLAALVENNTDAKEYSSIIEANSHDLLKLVSDVLALSEYDSAENRFDIEAVDVSMLCETNIDLIRSSLKEGVVIEYIGDDNCGSSTIYSNENGFSVILHNLLHNAMKFTRQGQISLAYKMVHEDNKMILTVTDTGCGIPREQQERVFDRFVKLNDFAQGTGLGLALCKIVANKLNGEIHIDSTYTSGARFVLTLPIDNK